MKQTNSKWNILKSSFHKKTSSIIVTTFIGFIVISFLFSGGSSFMQGTPDTLAIVGEHKIKLAEFERTFDYYVKMYSRMFGGKSLTSKQIESMKIQERARQDLINQKLTLIAASKLGIHPSTDEVKLEVKESIKSMARQDHFTVALYKNVLRYLKTTAQDFEADTKSRIALKKYQGITKNLPISNGYMQAVNSFKSNIIKIDIFKLDKNKLQKHLSVTNKEIKKYLADKNNLQSIKNLFIQRKSRFDTPEKILASHILLRADKNKTDKDIKKEIHTLYKKINTGNFAKMANIHTMDPSGKGKGGKLDWFSKDQMVPKFEEVAFNLPKRSISKPVKSKLGWHIIYVRNKKKAYNATLDKHKNELAKESIRRMKNQELKKLVNKVKLEVTNSLKNKRYTKLKSLQKKYSGEYQKDLEINRLDGIPENFKITPIQSSKIFQGKTPNIYSFDNVLNFVIINAKSKEKVTINSDDKKEKLSQSYILSNKLNQELLENISKNVKIKHFNILR